MVTKPVLTSRPALVVTTRAGLGALLLIRMTLTTAQACRPPNRTRDGVSPLTSRWATAQLYIALSCEWRITPVTQARVVAATIKY